MLKQKYPEYTPFRTTYYITTCLKFLKKNAIGSLSSRRLVLYRWSKILRNAPSLLLLIFFFNNYIALIQQN